MLLEEALFGDAFGMAQEAERPADEVRQDPVGDLAVELGQALLGDALVGPQQAAGIGEPHRQLARRLRPASAFGRGRRLARPIGRRPCLRPARGTPRAVSARHRCGRDIRSRPTAPARPSARPSAARSRPSAAAWWCATDRAAATARARAAAVKPEPQWPTGTSRLPAYSPSTSAPTDLGSTVEGTKPAITKLSLWLDFTFSHVFTRPER